MKELNSIDELLKVDESSAKESEVVFGELGPNAMECANAGLRVFWVAAKWLRKWEENQALNESFNKTAEELGITGQQLYAIVCRPPDPQGGDPRITCARGIDKEVSQLLARRTLLHLLWRAYRWGSAPTAYPRADQRAADGVGLTDRLGGTDRLCETLSSWRLLVGGLSPAATSDDRWHRQHGGCRGFPPALSEAGERGRRRVGSPAGGQVPRIDGFDRQRRVDVDGNADEIRRLEVGIRVTDPFERRQRQRGGREDGRDAARRPASGNAPAAPAEWLSRFARPR